MLLWDRKPVAFPHWCVWPPTTSLVPVLESPRGFPLWHDWETAPSSAITNGQIIRDNEQSCHHHTAFLEPNHPLTISMLIFPTHLPLLCAHHKEHLQWNGMKCGSSVTKYSCCSLLSKLETALVEWAENKIDACYHRAAGAPTDKVCDNLKDAGLERIV